MKPSLRWSMPDMSDTRKSLSAEEGIVYRVQGQTSVGIHHFGQDNAATGVLIVVGGRQYRVGAHRQFVLLARELAKAGIPVFRFDMRGMGDSDGSPQHFLTNSEDIKAAMNEFKRHSPNIRNVVVWGLCDGATASIMSLDALEHVSGVMMVNPWVTTRLGAAKVQIKHYYYRRVFNTAFWKKLFGGKLDFASSLNSLSETTSLVFWSMLGRNEQSAELPALVLDAIEQFEGPVRIVISNSDLTAAEFYEYFNQRYSKSTSLSDSVEIIHTDSDHTFSGIGQHDHLVNITLQFVQSCREYNKDQSSTSTGGG